MKYRLKRDLQFYLSGENRTIITVPRGTVVRAEHIPALDPFDREAFERRIKKEHALGFPHGQLIVFFYRDAYRSAYHPADIEALSWS